MTVFPHGDLDLEKGCWHGLQRSEKDGGRTAIVSCPGCGKIQSLSKHAIAEDGIVIPSLACHFECGFHDWVKLESWSALDEGGR